MYSLAIVCAKFLMDYRSCSPYEVTFYEGIFALIVNSILLAIFTNMPINDEDGKLDELLRLAKYDGKIYIDNFFATFSNMSISCILFSFKFNFSSFENFASSNIFISDILFFLKFKTVNLLNFILVKYSKISFPKFLFSRFNSLISISFIT